MDQGERFEQSFEQRYAHQSVISDTPVRQNRLDAGERIEVDLVSILARVGSHECRNQYITARLIDSAIIKAIGVASH